jgi:signal transduction histidine kinase
MIVHGEVIGAVSVSRHEAGVYGSADARNVRYLTELLSPYFYAIRAAEQARQSAIVEAEAKAREEGLRLGARRLTEALEAERQRIGMDLHDQTLADLTRLSRRLDRLAQQDGANRGELASIAAGLHTSMAALRQIIEEAKPTVLQLFGFAEAVENQLERAIRDSGQTVTGAFVDDSGGAIDRLPGATAVTLLRILQEAVNNAVAHADARNILVRLSASPRQIALTVTDDGKGLDSALRRGGTGIDNMRTRARLVGGRFSLGAGPQGVGTVVRVALAPADAEDVARAAT